MMLLCRLRLHRWRCPQGWDHREPFKSTVRCERCGRTKKIAGTRDPEFKRNFLAIRASERAKQATR